MILDSGAVIALDLLVARDAHDLQIAATAKATKRVLLTTDTDAFGDLPGVTHQLIG